jgi:Flp pilus assembly protein TadB
VKGRATAVHVGAVVAGAGAGALVGGRLAVPVGLGVVAALEVAVRRWEPADRRRERRLAALDLPVAADLLAAALRSGAPPERAARVVGAALGGPVGIRLRRVADGLRDGAVAADAWRAMSELAGGERLVRAAVRSADSGAALTGSLDRLAGDLRADRAAAAQARARRAGVLAVLPLGLCFLPAFLLAGVVPVVVAVLGDVFRAR